MRVVLRPICSMVPATSPNTTKSPISKGLSMPIDMDANMSLSRVCTARAMAMPPTPRLAIIAVISTPRLDRIDSSITVQVTSRTMMPIRVVVTGLRALPSRCRLVVHNCTAWSAQSAIWKASAMNQPWAMAASQRGDSSTRSEERRVGKECRSRWPRYQAEDGIRDADVTGVQTCALPISGHQPHHDADQGGGHRVAGLAIAMQAGGPQLHCMVGPERDLEGQRDEPAVGHGCLPAGRQLHGLEADHQGKGEQ